MAIVSHATDEALSDPLATATLRNGHVEHLEHVAGQNAAGKAHHGAHVVRDPPRTSRQRQLVLEHGARPRRVRGAREGITLQRRDLLNVVHGHGPQLQVHASQLVRHARDLNARGLSQPQPLALVFLGIRETRVHGQHERRIARLRLQLGRQQQRLA